MPVATNDQRGADDSRAISCGLIRRARPDHPGDRPPDRRFGQRDGGAGCDPRPKRPFRTCRKKGSDPIDCKRDREEVAVLEIEPPRRD